jgi:heme exporter protein B
MSNLYSGGFKAYFQIDLLLLLRRRGDLARPLIFFLIVSTLIPLGVSPEPQLLIELAPGLIWIMALLATLLSLDGLFAEDYQDGTLQQMLVSPNLLFMPVLGKVAAHWLVMGLPLALLSPVIALMFSLPSQALMPMVLRLVLGTAVLSFIGAVGAALTLPLRRGGVLLALLVMPFYMPVLIFGSATIQSALDGLLWTGPLTVLGAFLVLAIALCPLAIVGALRVSTEG